MTQALVHAIEVASASKNVCKVLSCQFQVIEWFYGYIRRPHSTYQKSVQGKCPFIFFILMGSFARTLFSRTLLPWQMLCCPVQILHEKDLEHLLWSNTSGFQSLGPLARTNFMPALCGLPIVLNPVRSCLEIMEGGNVEEGGGQNTPPRHAQRIFWGCFKPCVWDCSAQLQGVPGPPGPKCRKSLKKVVPGLSARSAKKCRKSRKSHEKVSLWHFFVTFSTFSTFFWHSGPTGPGRPFWDFFGILGPEGPALPVIGRYNRKPWFFFLYTLARKDYIHTFLFSELISRKKSFQLQKSIFREFISRELHIAYSFVIQRITWKIVWEFFFGNLISVTWNNVFGIDFAIISGWSVRLFLETLQKDPFKQACNLHLQGNFYLPSLNLLPCKAQGLKITRKESS